MTVTLTCLLLFICVLCEFAEIPAKNHQRPDVGSDRTKRIVRPYNVDVEEEESDEDGDDEIANVKPKPIEGLPSKREGERPKKWDHWGKWSSCSVSCGVGKISRWRHCTTGGCAPDEKEAQIKSCTLPAC